MIVPDVTGGGGIAVSNATVIPETWGSRTIASTPVCGTRSAEEDLELRPRSVETPSSVVALGIAEGGVLRMLPMI